MIVSQFYVHWTSHASRCAIEIVKWLNSAQISKVNLTGGQNNILVNVVSIKMLIES